MAHTSPAADSLSMTVGRDYRTSSKYEFVIYRGEKLVARDGYFPTYAAAKRAGMRVAADLAAQPEG
jgi:hypothetical protein